MNYIQLVKVTAPEICMTVLAVGILLLDVVWLRAWDVRRRAKWLGYLAALGLLGVFLLLSKQFSLIKGGSTILFADPSRILVLDGLTVFLKSFVVLLTIGAVLISIGYEFTRHLGEYFCVMVFAAMGMNFLITTENFLMFFVTLELVSICLYILTAFHKGLLRSAEAALKYFMFGAFSSAFLLFGLSYLCGLTGATNFNAMAVAIKTLMAQTGSAQPPLLLIVGLIFVIVGIGFKIAVVPFHLWAPDAYEGAPTPVAAFIATGSKLASFVIGGKILLVAFSDLRGAAFWSLSGLIQGQWMSTWHFSSGWTMMLAFIATASMIWGNLAAIAQRNVKRLLAYSSIAQAGYILVGLVAANQWGLTAVFFYLIAYALTNLGAFGVVAALTRAAGGDDIEDLDGMAQRAPFLSALLLIFFLSLAGLPPFAGFFGKFYLFAAAIKADPQHLGLLWLVIVGIATSAISLYYYLVVLKHLFVLPPRTAAPVISPGYWRYTLGVLGVAVILIGVYPQPLIELFQALTSSSGFIVSDAALTR